MITGLKSLSKGIQVFLGMYSPFLGMKKLQKILIKQWTTLEK